MGMAASQARYLALVARKSNCEYEGQQINQSRLILSNQSANLFNQMLGLAVPVSPSKMDYARTQYSYTDGITKYTMDKWVQLGEEDSDGYNYVVTYHYNSNIQTGSQKMKSNPQVQFSGAIPTSSTTAAADVARIQEAQKKVIDAQKDYEEKVNAYKSKREEASRLTTYQDIYTGSYIFSCTPSADGNSYTVYYQQYREQDGHRRLHYTNSNLENRWYDTTDGKIYDDDGSEVTGESIGEYTPVSEDSPHVFNKQSEANEKVKTFVDSLKEYGALPEDFAYDNVFYDETSGAYAFYSSFADYTTGNKKNLPLYYYDGELPDKADCISVSSMNSAINNLQNEMNVAKTSLDVAQSTFDVMSKPSYVGNTPLIPIAEITDELKAKIVQLLSDMKANDIDTTNIERCFNTQDGTYDNNSYIGGLYAYEYNSTYYYTTYYDLVASVLNGEGINNIDNQKKLPVYTVGAVSTPIEKTEKAIIETDTSGRFLSIRLESDSLKYTLNVETEIDEIAYEDAMNQYDYDKALYDKKVSDLNAKTKIIQQQDQDLELRLKQLDTEQNALNTEIDAVSKVVKDNIEKSFKTFGG